MNGLPLTRGAYNAAKDAGYREAVGDLMTAMDAAGFTPLEIATKGGAMVDSLVEKGTKGINTAEDKEAEAEKLWASAEGDRETATADFEQASFVRGALERLGLLELLAKAKANSNGATAKVTAS